MYTRRRPDLSDPHGAHTFLSIYTKQKQFLTAEKIEETNVVKRLGKVHTYLDGWFRWMGVRCVMCPKRFPETFSYKDLKLCLKKKALASEIDCLGK